MKKTLALILTIVTLLSVMVSCSGNGTTDVEPEVLEQLAGKTSDEIFDAIVEENKKTTNYTLLLSTKMYYNDRVVTNQLDTSKFDGKNQHLKMVPNGQVYLEYWWVDGVYYLSQNGSNYKKNITYEELLTQLGQDPNTPMFIGYPVTWFKDTVIKKDGSTYYLEGSISDEEFNKHSGAALGAKLSNIKFKVMVTEEGKFLSLNMTYNQKQNGIDYYAEAVGEFVDIGTTVVEKPANADNFINLG